MALQTLNLRKKNGGRRYYDYCELITTEYKWATKFLKEICNMFDSIFVKKNSDQKQSPDKESDAFVKERKENNKRISESVDALERSNPYTRESYKEYFTQAALVRDDMKQSKLFKEDRDNLWRRYTKMSDYVYNRQQSEYNEFKGKSESHKSIIVDKAYYCDPYNDGGLIGRILPGGYSKDSFNDLKSLSDNLKGVRELFAQWKDEMSKQDKSICWDAIGKAQDNLNLAFAELRGSRDQKQSEWRERTRDRIHENTAKLRKANDTLDRVQANISKLEDNISSARSDDFRDRAEGWLSEAESKACDIEAWIEKLESWISEDEAKIN